MGEKRQTTALALTCLFPILATLFVGARIASRYLGRNFGWDDWLIQLSLFLLICETVSTYQFILVSHTGFRAKEIPKQTLQQQLLVTKWSFAVQMIYHPLIGAARASIIMFLFRVKDPRRQIRFALHFAFWMNAAYTISTTLTTTFQCKPISYSYLRPTMDHIDLNGTVVRGGECIDSLDFILASCALSIVLDFIIIPIPTIMVYKLQMAFRTKLAIALVMSMGWIATLASISRLVVYYRRYTVPDRTYNIGLISSVIEPSLAIIAACAPTLRRLFAFLLPAYFEPCPSPPPTPDRQKQVENGEREMWRCKCESEDGSEGRRRRESGEEGLEMERCCKCRSKSKSRGRSTSTSALEREYCHHPFGHQLSEGGSTRLDTAVGSTRDE